MKKISILLSLLFLTIPMLQAQWNGVEDDEIDLGELTNKTYDNSIAVIPPMKFNSTIINLPCSQGMERIIIVDKGDDTAEINFCSTTETINFRLKKLVITNGNGKKLTFKQGAATTDTNGASVSPTNLSLSSDTMKVYYDAIVLYRGTAKQKEIVYKKYKLDKSPMNTFFTKNKANMPDMSGVQSGGETISTNFGASSAKGINVTKFADGFAKFLASRFKKELTISFFNRFKDKLNSDELKDLRTLFKNTSGELNLIDDKFTHYEAYLSSLRQSMEIDCHQIPEQLEKLVEDPTSQLSSILAKKPNIQYILNNVLTFGLEIKDSVHIGKALADLDFSKNLNSNPVDTNLMGSLETVQLISESLRNIKSGANQSYWISDSQIKELLETPSLLNHYLGLLAEKSKVDSIDFSSGSLFSLLTSRKLDEIKGLIESVISSIKSVEDIYNKTKGKISDRDKDFVALKYFDAASALINSSKHLDPLLPAKDAKSLQKYNTLATNINDMIRSAVTKNYSIGLLYLSKILTEVDSTNETLIKINSVIGNQGLFIAQMAESTNSDQVASIVENFAAPTGSWRDKRTARWNVALDSYVGPAYYNIKDNASRVAFSSPIGVSVTIPFNHVTFFVSAVDIGPLTSFRLTNDTSQVANVYLKEIISPGAFASINFGKNLPITVNAGYQYFPLLTKVEETENSVNINRKGGFSGSIVINIPIFTLYNVKED